MSPSFLDKLPFDILFCVAAHLSLEDIVHLSVTCRQLRALLDERTVCRSAVQVSIGNEHDAVAAYRQS